jgi:NCS2 family nucleobase:cation symporter-2
MARKPSNLIYSVNEKPPAITNLIMGFQHIFILSIAFIFPVVIINEIGGRPEDAENLIRMAMLATGFATMLQSVSRGPIGSGYLCPLVNGPAFVPASLLAGKAGGLPLIFGMTAAAGVFEALFSRVVGKMRKFFPPEVTGTVVLMVGVEVIPLAVPMFFGIDSSHPAIDGISFSVALLTMLAMVGFNVWGKGSLRLYSLLLGIAAGYAASYAVGLFTSDKVVLLLEAPWFSIPEIGKFGMAFQLPLLLPFLVAALSSALKTMGDLTTCQKINDADWKRMEMGSISRGILACAAGNIASGILGGLGQSVSSSNIGLSIATGATSRTIGYAAGGILIFLAFFPKLAAIFVIMPTPVMGAALVFAVCFMIVAGIQIVTSRMMDARKTFVVGISIIFGLSFGFASRLYSEMSPSIQTLFSSPLAVATICAIVLNVFFRIGISKKAVLMLEPGKDSSEEVFAFMEIQGSAWGARREVINNAIRAITELLDAAPALDLIGKKIAVSVDFDEFNLDVRAVYEGEPFEIPAALPRLDVAKDARVLSLEMAAFTMGRYADRIAFSQKGEMTELHLHFDH